MKKININRIGYNVHIFQCSNDGNWYASCRCKLGQLMLDLGTTKRNKAAELALSFSKDINSSSFSLESNKPTLPKPVPWFTQEDVEKILGLANDKEKFLYEVLAFTGLRISEVVRLNWSDIDFDKGTILVKPTLGNPSKNGRSRIVPMPDRVKSTLMKMKADSGLVFHSAKNSKYPNADGQLSEKSAISNLNKICLKLGIKGSVHSFRQFFYKQRANVS
jgi:integrase